MCLARLQKLTTIFALTNNTPSYSSRSDSTKKKLGAQSVNLLRFPHHHPAGIKTDVTLRRFLTIKCYPILHTGPSRVMILSKSYTA